MKKMKKMCGKKTRLIDAEALKLSHCKECSLYPDKCMGDDCDCGAIIHINEMPTIDAEPVRHGKWIFNPSDAFEAMFAKPKCSECGFESADGGNYCPNCGCRMDEE